MNNLSPLNEEDESCINSILEAGLDEIKTNQASFLATSQIIKKSNNSNSIVNNSEDQYSKIKQSAALKDIISLMKTSNNYISSSEEEDFHPINNITKAKANYIHCANSSKTQRLKDMKTKLDSLQQRISLMDNKLIVDRSSNSCDYKLNCYQNRHKRGCSMSYRSDSMNNIRNTTNNLKKRFKSANRSQAKIHKQIKPNEIKSSEALFKERYLKLKIENDNSKNVLINQRRKINDLNKKSNRFSKKALAYDELFDENQKILESNEKLYLKFEESEAIRNEQSKLICSLQKEVERLRGEFDTHDIGTSSQSTSTRRKNKNNNKTGKGCKHK